VSYYVVVLEHDDPLASGDYFHWIGCRLAREATERIMAQARRTGDTSFIHDLGRAEMYTFFSVSLDFEYALPDWVKAHLPTEEYARFGKVYFLNETALRMYRDGGVEFDDYWTIGDDELPTGCSLGIGASFLPKT
jgi:hypothetical protein